MAEVKPATTAYLETPHLTVEAGYSAINTALHTPTILDMEREILRTTQICCTVLHRAFH